MLMKRRARTQYRWEAVYYYPSIPGFDTLLMKQVEGGGGRRKGGWGDVIWAVLYGALREEEDGGDGGEGGPEQQN